MNWNGNQMTIKLFQKSECGGLHMASFYPVMVLFVYLYNIMQ